MKSIKNGAGFTLIELLVSVIISAAVIFAILSIVTFTTRTLSESGIEQGLQIDMDSLARQITGGVSDPGDVSGGLRGAAAYNVVNPQQINFSDTNGVWRSFTAVNGVGGSLTYNSPTQLQNPAQIYDATVGTVLEPAHSAPSILNITFATVTAKLVNISMSVTRMVNGKLLTGSVMTSVCLRNAPA